MFEGFQQFDIQTSDPLVKIRTVVGGKGPPVLLLHGNPLTHVHWHRVAPRLAENFTVVATDLRGYGDSGKPRGLADHSNYSFRHMAQPFDFPDQLLAGKEEYYIRHKLEKQGLGKGGISEEALREYIRCCTPENIHGVCEDCRAAAGIDLEMDTQDFAAGRKTENTRIDHGRC